MKACPICLNSSGYTAYVRNGGQKCTTCNGTGKITNSKFIELSKAYGDLIKEKTK